MKILVLLNGQQVITLENQEGWFDAGKDIAALGLFSTSDTVAQRKGNGEMLGRSYTPLEEPLDSSKGSLLYNRFCKYLGRKELDLSRSWKLKCSDLLSQVGTTSPGIFPQTN